MKIGIVGSSGGAVFCEMLNSLHEVSPGRHSYHVVTDRPCGLEAFCVAKEINHCRIEERDNRQFGIGARRFFEEYGGVDMILLFFVRVVTKELFRYCPTFNLHPSLLPAFKGFDSIKKAWQERVKFFGATLHLVNDSIDGGPIIAQILIPVDPAYQETHLRKISFVQKVYLSLLLIELIETGAVKVTKDNSECEITKNLPYTDRCNPAMRDARLIRAVLELQAREKVIVVT